MISALRQMVRVCAYQAGPISSAVSAALVWSALARWINKDTLGDISYALAAANTLAPALSLGLSIHLAMSLARTGPIKGNTELRVAFVVSATLVVLSLSASGISLAHPSISPILAISLATASVSIALGALRGIDAPYTFAFVTVGLQLFALAALGAVVAVSGSIALGSASYAASCALISIAGLRRLATRVRVRTIGTALHRVLIQSVQYIPHLVLSVALVMGLRILVGVIRGPSELAEFQFSSLIIGGVLTIASSLDAHLSVRVQESQSLNNLYHRLRSNHRKMQSAIGAASIMIALIYVSGGIRWWIPAEYDNRAIMTAVALALPAGAAQVAADVGAAGAVWIGKRAVISLATVAAAGSSLALCAIFVAEIGWTFSGLALSVGSLARLLCLWLFTRRDILWKYWGLEGLLFISGQAILSIGLLLYV